MYTADELIKKYRWAGKIRFISFMLLFLFLLLMKFIGGFSYLNISLISLIVVEALLNQPYDFFLKRVDLYRFQFYQMSTDIIAISWIFYYLGGLEAPLVTIAYYAVILWAGVVSGVPAVFFAVLFSSACFSTVVVLTESGMFETVRFLNYQYSPAQAYSLLLGNLSFMFAFGYFGAYSAKITRDLGRDKIREQLGGTHKLLAAGCLISGISHDAINNLASMRGYTRMLEGFLEKLSGDEQLQYRKVISRLKNLQAGTGELLNNLSRFSQRPEEGFEAVQIKKIVDDAVFLTAPLARMSRIEIQYRNNIATKIVADKDMLKEALVAVLLYLLDVLNRKGVITVSFEYRKDSECVIIEFLSYSALREPDRALAATAGMQLDRKKTVDVGLAVAGDIISLHGGRLTLLQQTGAVSSVHINLPITRVKTATIHTGTTQEGENDE